MKNLKIRWKLLAVVLPLVVLPIGIVGSVVGYIANQQAYRGITQTSKDDLEHMAQFTLDLLASHHRQFQVYKQDKQRTIQRDLTTLLGFAYNLVETEHRRHTQGKLHLASAQQQVREALQAVNIGETGYIYAMTTAGNLTIHPAREGENIYDERDHEGRYFIREMCAAAVASEPGEVLYTVYPWKNAILGDEHPRRKVVAYRYFQPWEWVIAAGSYAEETYEDVAFEKQAFASLKEDIKSKRVGQTGYIYTMTTTGELTIHPFREGERIYDERDDTGRPFIREMCDTRSGWIRYPWKNVGDPVARMKIVRYDYFAPWDWIVAVGSYEDEFYGEANQISGRIFVSMLALTAAVGFASVLLVFLASKVLTDPIQKMTRVMREVRRGRMDTKMDATSGDELGELAEAFDQMTATLKRNKELEETLAQQGKMASLGVLSSGVAHEINNPLGVILGYAGHMERKMDPSDPNFRFVQDIKQESKRCKKIVQDLLSYARVPKPTLEATDLNELLDQIVEFSANHVDMYDVTLTKDFDPRIPPLMVDGDQIRQVAINLILNAGSAMREDGKLSIKTALRGDSHVEIVFQDNGAGIPKSTLEKIFEPFFTTKSKGTGLGLAITKQIVEQHLGTIRIDSEVGQGTTVTVRLPVTQEEL